jgi:hypothetical protein
MTKVGGEAQKSGWRDASSVDDDEHSRESSGGMSDTENEYNSSNLARSRLSFKESSVDHPWNCDMVVRS